MLTAEEKEALENFDWSTTTYEGARREHLKRDMKCTFLETLQWLEEAAAVSEMLRNAETITPSSTPSR